MSDNLDLVRSIYVDWERGEYGSAEWADPQIEYTVVGGQLFVTQTWTGLAGMAEGARSIIDVVDQGSIKAEEYVVIDEHRVLALDHLSGTYKHSGIKFGGPGDIPTTGAHLFHISNGKVTRLVVYFDRHRAVGDLGLTPEGS